MTSQNHILFVIWINLDYPGPTIGFHPDRSLVLLIHIDTLLIIHYLADVFLVICIVQFVTLHILFRERLRFGLLFVDLRSGGLLTQFGLDVSESLHLERFVIWNFALCIRQSVVLLDVVQ